MTNTTQPAAAFDPAAVRIERHRGSVTQREVSVFYGEELLGRFRDNLERCTDNSHNHDGAACFGGLHGRGDRHWVDVAAYEVAQRGARVRRELVETLEHATFSTLPTHAEATIQSALDDGVIVAVSVTGAGHQVYALAEARDRAAILHALAGGPSVLSNHPHEAVQAALRDGVIRAWGPSATGRTVYALAPATSVKVAP